MSGLRQVAKSLVLRPWYTTPIVVVIAIGCALLTTVFAVVDGVLFKPLGYPGESRLVAINVSSSRGSVSSVLPEDLAAWADSAPGVAFSGFRAQPEDSTSVARAVVQSNFFDVIGIRPALGGFSPEDFEPSVSKIEPRLITDEVFRSQFGSDRSAIGRVVILDPSVGYGYRVVGVMPKGFTFPAYQFSVGYLTTYRNGSNVAFRHVIARLAADTSADEVRQRILAAATARNDMRSSSTSPGTPHIDRVAVESLSGALGAASRTLFALLLIAAGFLVAVAALNVSSLMAARSIDRGRELEVRRALGATERSIARLVVAEAALLVTAGAILGLISTVPLLRVTRTLLPNDLALFKPAAVDWRVVAFTAVLAAVVGTLISIWPLRLARAARGTLGSMRNVTFQVHPWSQRLVVVIQVALALLLTIGGSLLVASLLSVYVQTPPITTRNTMAIEIRFLGPEAINRVTLERVTRAKALTERLRSVPGVQGAAVTAYELLDRAYVRSWFKPPMSALNPRLPTMTQAVTTDFYRVVDPKLVQGRFPTADELATDEPLIVVSRTVAKNYWPNTSPIGQTLTDQGPASDLARTFTVVGVIEDIRWFSWDEPPLPMIYGPYALLARQSPAVVLIRSSADDLSPASVLRAMAEIDPLLRTERIAPLRELFADSVRPRRFLAWLFGSFSVATLCVVVIGIFGQLAMSTARRTREVGIRMSCGATRGAIIRLIVAEQLTPVLAGLLVGGVGAGWSVQFVRSYLYQVTAFDPRVWAGAIGMILLTAFAGMVVPALRASRTDPTQALRVD